MKRISDDYLAGMVSRLEAACGDRGMPENEDLTLEVAVTLDLRDCRADNARLRAVVTELRDRAIALREAL